MAAAAAAAKKGSKKFVLVRWVEEDSVGVMPIAAAPNSEDLYVGCFTQMKWTPKGKKLYEVEVLKISEDQQILQRECTRLVNFEISREDLLKESEKEVSTTAATPKAKPRKKSTQKVEASSKSKSTPKATPKSAREAELISAVKKAKSLFFDQGTTSSSSLPQKPRPQKPSLPQKEIPKKGLNLEPPSRLPYEDEELLGDELGELGDEYHSVEKRPKYDSSDSESDEAVECLKAKIKSLEKKLRHNSQVKPVKSVKSDKDAKGAAKNKDVSQDPAMTELVPGYGVYILTRDLHEALATSRNSPTRLIRNLVSIFFTKSVLAKSSAFGGRVNEALDKVTLSACFRYVQEKHKDVSKTSLVDAVNDKCANARRS